MARFESTLGFVDHVDAALAAHDTAIAMPAFQRAERVSDLHLVSPTSVGAGRLVNLSPRRAVMVGDTRIELVTPSMSTKCSTAELIARKHKRRKDFPASVTGL